MRREFSDYLYQKMKTDPDIYLLVGDLGYKVFDDHFKDFPSRCINCGAAEQTMLDIAVGLAYRKKKVVVYTITPFLYRGFETIRTYIAYEQLPVIMAGSGRDTDYTGDGYSHDSSDVSTVLGALQGLKLCFPETIKDIPALLDTVLSEGKPTFISLRR